MVRFLKLCPRLLMIPILVSFYIAFEYLCFICVTVIGDVYAIKKFKPDREGEFSFTGISQSAIREIAVC